MNISPKAIYKWYSETLQNPKYAWMLILGTLIYLISPFDISPDLIPFLGQIDDVFILSLMVNGLFQLIANSFNSPNSPMEENVNKDNENDNQNVKTIDVDAVSID